VGCPLRFQVRRPAPLLQGRNQPTGGDAHNSMLSLSFETVMAQKQPTNSIESACWPKRECSSKKSSIKVGLPVRDLAGLFFE
jgi:hypothetical protein